MRLNGFDFCIHKASEFDHSEVGYEVEVTTPKDNFKKYRAFKTIPEVICFVVRDYPCRFFRAVFKMKR